MTRWAVESVVVEGRNGQPLRQDSAQLSDCLMGRVFAKGKELSDVGEHRAVAQLYETLFEAAKAAAYRKC